MLLALWLTLLFPCPSTMPHAPWVGIVHGQKKSNFSLNAISMCFFEHEIKQRRAFHISITECFEYFIDEVFLKLQILGSR